MHVKTRDIYAWNCQSSEMKCLGLHGNSEIAGLEKPV